MSDQQPPANDEDGALTWRLNEVLELDADGQFKPRAPTAEDKAQFAWMRRPKP